MCLGQHYVITDHLKNKTVLVLWPIFGGFMVTGFFCCFWQAQGALICETHDRSNLEQTRPLSQ